HDNADLFVMAPPVDTANVETAISIAADVARGFGLKVEEPVPLRSTNNAVAWLRPANVVAKVSTRHNSRLDKELQVVRQLYAFDAPVVSPAPELPAVVHYCHGFEMTFWRYYAQQSATEAQPDRLAVALRQLYAALGRLPPALKGTLPSYMAELNSVRSLFGAHTTLSAITSADRDLLRNTFDRLRARIEGL